MPDAYLQEVDFTLKNERLDTADFHYLDSLIEYPMKLNEIKIEFNSLDHLTFGRFIQILEENENLLSINFKFFSLKNETLLINYLRNLACLYESPQPKKGKNSNKDIITDEITYLLNSLLKNYTHDMDKFFSILINKRKELNSLTLNFEMPSYVASNDKFVELLQKYFLLILEKLSFNQPRKNQCFFSISDNESRRDSGKKSIKYFKELKDMKIKADRYNEDFEKISFLNGILKRQSLDKTKKNLINFINNNNIIDNLNENENKSLSEKGISRNNNETNINVNIIDYLENKENNKSEKDMDLIIDKTKQNDNKDNKIEFNNNNENFILIKEIDYLNNNNNHTEKKEKKSTSSKTFNYEEESIMSFEEYNLNNVSYNNNNISLESLELSSKNFLVDTRKYQLFDKKFYNINLKDNNIINLSIDLKFFKFSEKNWKKLIPLRIQILKISDLDFYSLKNLKGLFSKKKFNEMLSLDIFNTNFNYYDENDKTSFKEFINVYKGDKLEEFKIKTKLIFTEEEILNFFDKENNDKNVGNYFVRNFSLILVKNKNENYLDIQKLNEKISIKNFKTFVLPNNFKMIKFYLIRKIVSNNMGKILDDINDYVNNKNNTKKTKPTSQSTSNGNDSFPKKICNFKQMQILSDMSSMIENIRSFLSIEIPKNFFLEIKEN